MYVIVLRLICTMYNFDQENNKNGILVQAVSVELLIDGCTNTPLYIVPLSFTFVTTCTTLFQLS